MTLNRNKQLRHRAVSQRQIGIIFFRRYTVQKICSKVVWSLKSLLASNASLQYEIALLQIYWKVAVKEFRKSVNI